MDISQIRENLEALPDEIYTAEFSYLEAKALLDHLGDLKKHLLAALMENALGSNPERERKALASDEYKNHIKGLYEQAKITAQLGAKYHRLDRKFEAMRSLNKNV